MDNPAILLRRLNPYSARAMEGAASLCQTRSHAEILPEHWLLKLLEQGEGDLTVLARRYTWDMDAIWQDLLTFMDKLPRSVRSRPQLSDAIQTLMQEAWLRASLEGEEQIRSLHLLMGRLREKLDDDLPELTEGLVSLLWPHYMRTIPSLAIVEFFPDWRSLRQAEMLAEGFSVLSRPVGPHKTACQYRTTRDVSLQPLQLAEARLHTETDGRSAIRLRFECPEKVDWRKAGIDKVAIFLNAESPVSSALHLAMTRRVHAMYARHAGTHTERHQFNGWCKPMGFDDNDGLWKKADTAFSGYQLLLEYFSFRPKFMFVELRGLDTIGLTAASTWFEIDMVLSEAWSSDLPFETENFRLHCAPVINLFTLEADPLTLNPLENEYLLRPLRLQDGHTEIYSVDNIHGAVKNGKHPYVPFTSFRHRGGMMRHDAPERYFHTRVKRGPSGLYDTWLILGGRSFELEQLSDKPESLSMRITGTNGQLPRKALESTLLDRVVKTGKVPVRVLNVTAPTMPLSVAGATCDLRPGRSSMVRRRPIYAR